MKKPFALALAPQDCLLFSLLRPLMLSVASARSQVIPSLSASAMRNMKDQATKNVQEKKRQRSKGKQNAQNSPERRQIVAHRLLVKSLCVLHTLLPLLTTSLTLSGLQTLEPLLI